MKTRRIGRLEVSVIGVGCNNFGWRLDLAASEAVVHAALDAGITLFDTADIYGDARSEVLLGKALGKAPRRHHPRHEVRHADPGRPAGASPTYLRQAVEHSLRRLGTDRIDLYQLHQPDPATPISATLGVLDELVRAGKVREIGCSNMSVAQLREAAAVTRPGHAAFVSVQNELSLLHRDDVETVLPECVATRMAYLPFFPLAGGMLTGKYQGAAGASAKGRLAGGGGLADRFRTPEAAAVVDRLSDIAKRAGHSMLDLALRLAPLVPARRLRERRRDD